MWICEIWDSFFKIDVLPKNAYVTFKSEISFEHMLLKDNYIYMTYKCNYLAANFTESPGEVAIMEKKNIHYTDWLFLFHRNRCLASDQTLPEKHRAHHPQTSIPTPHQKNSPGLQVTIPLFCRPCITRSRWSLFGWDSLKIQISVPSMPSESQSGPKIFNWLALFVVKEHNVEFLSFKLKRSLIYKIINYIDK